MQADLDLALSLAAEADEISLARFGALDLRVETKPDTTPVTDADRAVEELLRARLSVLRPGDGILGEEFGASGASSRTWVIDPIDGTKNFMRGVPVWATLIALLEENTPIVGVVSAPALGRTWFASQGHGAWIRDHRGTRRIHVSKVSNLADASVSFSELTGWGDRYSAALHLFEQCWRARAYGDFWSHMLVAEGVVDFAPEPALALWDMAALDIIVREAGGRFSSIDGIDGIHDGSGVSSNGHLHDQIVKALAR